MHPKCYDYTAKREAPIKDSADLGMSARRETECAPPCSTSKCHRLYAFDVLAHARLVSLGRQRRKLPQGNTQRPSRLAKLNYFSGFMAYL